MTDRDKNKFYDVEIRELTSIKNEFKKAEKKYSQFIDPHLVFKINLNQSVSDEIFRKEIGYADIVILK